MLGLSRHVDDRSYLATVAAPRSASLGSFDVEALHDRVI